MEETETLKILCSYCDGGSKNMVSKYVILLLFLFVGFIQAGIGPRHDKVVACHLATWSVYRQGRGSFQIENIDPTLCTHILYSFVGLDSIHSEIKCTDAWQDLPENQAGFPRTTLFKRDYPHLKVILAIGGWNEGSKSFSDMAGDISRRNKFVASAVNFIGLYNFDGLVIDWRFPGQRGGTVFDKFNYIPLLKELKAAFSKHNLILAVDLGPTKYDIDIGYDVKAMSVHVDYIFMMCYDYHGFWQKKLGANAPLRSSDASNAEYTMKYMLKEGAPPKKLVMGIPLYGRTFILREPVSIPKFGILAQDVGFGGPLSKDKGFIGYNEICLELHNPKSGWTAYWDNETRTPYAANKEKVISYDNEDSINEKAEFIVEMDLAGAMVWSIDTDDFQGDCGNNSMKYPLMTALNNALQKYSEIKAIEEENNREVINGKSSQKVNGAMKYITLNTIVGFVFYIS